MVCSVSFDDSPGITQSGHNGAAVSGPLSQVLLRDPGRRYDGRVCTCCAATVCVYPHARACVRGCIVRARACGYIVRDKLHRFRKVCACVRSRGRMRVTRSFVRVFVHVLFGLPAHECPRACASVRTHARKHSRMHTDRRLPRTLTRKRQTDR